MKHTSTSPQPRGQGAPAWLRVLGCSFALVLAAAFTGTAKAGTITSSQTGDFSTTTTWNGGVVPVIGDGNTNVDIRQGHVVSHSSGTAGVDDRIRIGVDSGMTGTFTINGGTFLAAGNAGGATTVGTNTGRTGTLNISSGLGSFNSQNILLAPNAASNLGIVNVSGGTLTQNGGEFTVGDVGTGILNVSGGLLDVVVDTNEFDVGQGSGAFGSVNMTGGVIQTGSGAGGGSTNIGGNSVGGAANATQNGVLDISGGTFSQNPDAQASGTSLAGESDFRVATGSGTGTTLGTLNLSGTGYIVLGRDMFVGVNQGASGFFNMSGGSLDMDGDLFIGNNQSTGAGGGSYGEMNFSGGVVRTSRGAGQGGSITVGNQGTGILNVTGGHLGSNGAILVGNAGTSNANAQATTLGSVNQTGGLVSTTTDALGAASAGNPGVTIGASGLGFYTISGGTLDSDGAILVGDRTGNTVNQNFPAGTGVLTISGDDTLVIADSDFQIANNFDNNDPASASEGHMTLNGGLASSNNMLLANRGLGFYTQTGGTLDLMGSFVVGDSGSNVAAVPTIVAGSGFANITGGVVDIDDALVIGDGNQGATGGIQYQDSRAALGSVNIDLFGTSGANGVKFSVNTASADLVNDDSHTDIGFNGTGFLTLGGGTFLSNHAAAIGTNGLDGDGGEDSSDVRLGVAENLNNPASPNFVMNSEGNAPFGQLDITGGAMLVARDLNAGVGSFSTGNVTMIWGWDSDPDRDGSDNKTELRIDGDARIADGNDSNGTLTVTGGVLETGFAARNSLVSDDGGNLDIGDGQRSEGVANLSGGSIFVAADLRAGVQADSQGTINISGDAIVEVGETGTNGAGGGTQEIRLAENPSAMGVINLSGGSLVGIDTGNMQVGVGGTGLMNISGGELSLQASLNIAQNQGSVGSVNMTGGIINLADPVVRGLAGTITNNGDNIAVGVQGNNPAGATSATGYLNVSGGTIEVDSTFDGQTGNDDNTNRQIAVGVRAGAVGIMEVSGDAYIHANELAVGEGSDVNNANDAGRILGPAVGVYTQTGGSAVFDGTGTNQTTANGAALIIGQFDDATGTVNVDGGHLILNGDILIADQGTVTLHTAGNNTRFATVFGASEGFFNQTGGTVDVGNGSGGGDNIIAGQRGEGTVNVSGGVLNVDNLILLGSLADAVGTDAGGLGTGTGIMNVSGTADVNVGNDINVSNADGNANDNQLNISGGAVTIDDELNIANGNNRNGNVTLSGGLLQVGDRLRIGGGNATSTGSFNMSGGTLELGSSIGILHVDTDAGDTLGDITGGVIRPADPLGTINLLTTAAKDLNLYGGTLDMRGGALIDTGAGSGTTGGGGVSNNDVKVNGDNGGGAILNAANFDADVIMGPNGGTNGGLIDISQDGTQRIMTLVNEGGTTLRDFTASGGTIVIDLFGDGVIGDGATDSSVEGGGGANSAIIANDVSLTAGATIKVVNNSVALDLNEQWDILGWFDFLGGTEGAGSGPGVLPAFDFSMATLGAGLSWDTSLFLNSGVIQIIPEPTRVLLTLLGLAGIAMQRRRRRSGSILS